MTQKIMEHQTNKWKIATIVLGVIALGLIVYPYFNKPEIVDIQGFEIPKENLEELMEITAYGQLMKICSIETRECIVVQKLMKE